VKADSRLMMDLGADSLDLVELMFLLEEEFGIRMSREDLSLSAQLGLPEEELRQGEVLTPRALELLRQRFPAAADTLREGATRRDLAALLTVEEIARSVRARLQAGAA
jgi:acyl carrier protein